MIDLPVRHQDIPRYLELLVAEAAKTTDATALRREFMDARPEIVVLAGSCAGEAMIKSALDSVAMFFDHARCGLPAHFDREFAGCFGATGVLAALRTREES
jgi:hypothetical protein